jgi:Family of unknown function (DUF6572)
VEEEGALFDAVKVDVVSLSSDGTVELYIVQDHQWTGSDAQLNSLQAKVHNYVGYALDGQLARDYPETVDKPWQIVVHCQTGAPDERTQYVLSELTKRLRPYGGSLRTIEK